MASIDYSKFRLLIVDDVPITRAVARKHADAIGIPVIEEAEDGVDAIEKVLSFKPDIVLCDIRMKIMDGLSFLKSVRIGEQSLPRDLMVIITSVLHDNPAYGTALALDTNAFLPKPFTRGAFTEKVERCLASKPEIRDVAAYRRVEIPGVDFADNQGPAGEKRISSLKTGDILVEDLRMNNGSLLLAAGTELSAEQIANLNDLAQTSSVFPGVARTADTALS